MVYINLSNLETAIINRLEPITTSRLINVRGFPDDIDIENYATSGMGVCLVGISGSSSSKPTNVFNAEHTQISTLNIELVLLQRGTKTYRACYPTIEQIIQLLAGYKPIMLPGNSRNSMLWLEGWTYKGVTKNEKLWTYSIRFGMELYTVNGACT